MYVMFYSTHAFTISYNPEAVIHDMNVLMLRGYYEELMNNPFSLDRGTILRPTINAGTMLRVARSSLTWLGGPLLNKLKLKRLIIGLKTSVFLLFSSCRM